jgi:hypothetical protein
MKECNTMVDVTKANTRQMAGINRMRPANRQRKQRGSLSTESHNSMLAKHKENIEYEARQLIDRAKEVIPRGRYRLGIKKLNDALDLRTISNMGERARIAATIDYLKSRNGIKAMEMIGG